ncbi:Pyridoxamine 5'-phosphate oxidase [Mycobacteroides salmoniphilum]|uniref:Pyridoxamine 5'-phosphate oxidase n=1 Tax=Mycobacteroides salmoniphilum TaxID=404941 RepID=A0A4R8S2A6_9MYCO|nr:PPOX class F420-dependent oxidoreductase [Mycobacteroides salmoniphilum]TDZ79913.1 Pyridoxamine 5'-phosphate oxidase [Mycobacteroides salmoniphilum]
MVRNNGLDIDTVAAGRYILLTTFTKDGVPKPTPMGFVAEGDELLLTTSANTWKVRRVRRDRKVRVAVCTRSGRVISPVSDATAVIVEDPASVARIRASVVKRYGLPSRIVTAWLDRRNGARVGISVTLGAPETL